MSIKKPHRIHLDLLSGRAHGVFADFWFRYIGYCLVVAVIYGAVDLTDSDILVGIKWLSILALWGWLRYQAERLFFYIWPETEPDWGYRPKKWQLVVTNTLVLPLVAVAFIVGIEFAEIVLHFKA